MNKLRLSVIVLSFLLIFTACKKAKESIEVTAEDSLKTILDTITSDKKLEEEVTPEKNHDEQMKEAYERRIATLATNEIIEEKSLSQIASNLGDGVTSSLDSYVTDNTMSTMTASRSRVSVVAKTSYNDGTSIERSVVKGLASPNVSSLSDNLGFSVGGAKDIGNFRENIKKGFMPIEEDITHEGIFYDYFFDNNIEKEATHLFEPSYTSYKNKHPLTNEEELYLSVGLNSNLKASSFERKKLNLTIVLDISGSMNHGFSQYYYDGRQRNNIKYDGEWDARSKIEIAKECMIDLTKHLNKDDRLAVVLFDSQAHLAKPFNLLNKTNMQAIREHIRSITSGGSTNMYAGFSTASELYEKLPNYDTNEYDNRIIFLTDAMPNKSVTDKNSIWGLMKVNAEKKVYTTFIGVGVDLNNELINYITKTPGANYYSVHNAQEFIKRMDTQFDFMVTPLVFDLTLHLKSDKYDIEAIYGAPEANQATGEIMKVNTLFPSESKDGKTRGGIILVKLKKVGKGNDDLLLKCSYKDRNGIPELISEQVKFTHELKGSDNGIRKAVLLSRFVNLMHNWINNKTLEIRDDGDDDWQYSNSRLETENKNNWENRPSQLTVSSYYQEIFSTFKEYFDKEAKDIKDEDLKQESDILDFLVDENRVSVNNPVKDNELSHRKDILIREWFMVVFLPRINQEFDRYKLRKTIRGELDIKLIFKNDEIVIASIKGKGSINDKDFIDRIQPIFNNKSYPDIGDYQFEINNLRFE